MLSVSSNEARREVASSGLRVFRRRERGRMMTEGYGIPIAEAARRLGTTEIAVLMHIKQGRLQGSEIDGAWYVPVADLDSLRSEGAKATPHLCRGGCGSAGCSAKG